MSNAQSTRDNRIAKPRYLQILEQLRNKIHNGHYQSGDKLPTEAELMKQFEVSRTTASRAVRDLEAEGMLERRQGSGTYVCKNIKSEQVSGICYFTPFVEPGCELPYVEGLIHQHLAQLIGRDHTSFLLQLLVRSKAGIRERIIESTRRVIESGVEGVLYYPVQLPHGQNEYNRIAVDMLVKAGLHVVLIDRDIVPLPDRSEFTRIGYDNRRGAFLLTDHLVKQGCQRIACIGIDGISTSVDDRMAGYYDALRFHGLEVEAALQPKLHNILYGAKRMQGVVARSHSASLAFDLPNDFCEKLMKEVKPDAIIGFSDQCAALIGRQLTTMGLEIGKDVLLAGFDNDPIASLLPVPMTTVHLPAQPFARAAYIAIMQEIQAPSSNCNQVIIDCELLVRLSTQGI